MNIRHTVSDTQALRDLLAKVEAGEWWDNLHRPDYLHTDLCWKAFQGSLDAAKALHDAVLPGWMGSFTTDGFARVAKGGRVLTVMECHHLDNSPARAWLICILRALIAQATP